MNGLGCLIVVVGVLIIGGGIYFIGNNTTASSVPKQEQVAGNGSQQQNAAAPSNANEQKNSQNNPSAENSQDKQENAQASAPTRSKEWTPEQINKEPAKYLQEMLNEAKVAQEKLKSINIDLQTRYRKYSRIALEKRNDADGAKIVLEKAKETYRDAQQKNEWPAKFYVKRYEQERLENIIIQLHGIQTRSKALADKYDSLTTLLQTKIKILKQKSASVQETVVQINHNLEIVKAGEMMKDVGKIIEETNVSLDISDILADRELDVAMTDLVKVEAQSAADKRAFKAIMGQ